MSKNREFKMPISFVLAAVSEKLGDTQFVDTVLKYALKHELIPLSEREEQAAASDVNAVRIRKVNLDYKAGAKVVDISFEIAVEPMERSS